MQNISTEKIELAARFVNSTSSHIFLTGKAGTGKTTFLRDLAKSTHKNFVIVAPTGVAALNAGGVTIHSQFLFPFGSFLVGGSSFSSSPGGNFFDRHQMARRHPLNSNRKQVLRNIDLLVIDEVSMLRADLLDAIDYRLKSVKNDFTRPFGGVQLLVIGDLYQLPPIVKPYEWQQLKSTYASMHFFESMAWQKSNFVYVELDKIFRQKDDRFIGLLNNIRNNTMGRNDVEELNTCFKESCEAEKTITITTHNSIADRLNRQELEKLSGESSFYDAEIQGDFPENLFPLPGKLELREGAKVMFIKNDPEDNAFYNGKLAEVIKLSNDGVHLKMEDDDDFVLKKYRWENKKYNLNSVTKEIEDEIVGAFTQYPIKLAWAITVHKSQGLTFEKAVVDVGKAFAPGQVYVALSRLRSLKGLTLRTRISEAVVSSDAEVVRFSKNQEVGMPLSERLKSDQAGFMGNFLQKAFDFSEIISQIDFTQKKTAEKTEFEDEEMRMALQKLKEKFMEQEPVTGKFKAQIKNLIAVRDHERLLERLGKANDYFLDFLDARLKELLIHIGYVEQVTKTKTYLNFLGEIDQLIAKKSEQILKSRHLCQSILENKPITILPGLVEIRRKRREQVAAETKKHIRENPKNHLTKTGRKRKQSTKGETYQTTFVMVREGMTADEIAEKRGLAATTIEGHLAQGVANGELSLGEFMEEGEFNEIASFFDNDPESNLTPIFEKTDGKYSYGKLRMVRAGLKRKSSIRNPQTSPPAERAGSG